MVMLLFMIALKSRVKIENTFNEKCQKHNPNFTLYKMALYYLIESIKGSIKVRMECLERMLKNQT